MRNKSYGEDYKLSPVDKFGVYLSLIKIHSIIRKIKEPINCLDLGCGYYAKTLYTISSYIEEGTGVDISICEDLNSIKNLKLIESPIESAFDQLSSNHFNLIIMNSVIEHISEPLIILRKVQEHLAEKGILFINVPTWLGKPFLEFFAFKLGLIPSTEIDDHKTYYDKKDLWLLLIKAGFKPSKIEMNYHKFGLNLFCKIIK